MINSLALQNFKSIDNKDPLTFKKLSILCGSNSSGKSSVIQALLMLGQTFSSKYLKSAVSLNGQLVRLGSFSDILNHVSTEKSIEIKVDLENLPEDTRIEGVNKIQLEFKFSGRDEQGKRFEGDFHPSITSGRVLILRSDGTEEYIKFEPHENKALDAELFVVKELDERNTQLLSKEFPDFKIEGASRQDTIPNLIKITYDHNKKLSYLLVPYLINSPSYIKTIDAEHLSDLGEITIYRPVLDKIAAIIQQEYEERLQNFELPKEIVDLINTNSKIDLNANTVKEYLVKQAMVLAPELILQLFKQYPEGMNVSEWRNITRQLDENVHKALLDFLIRHRETIQGVWRRNSKIKWVKKTFVLPTLKKLDHYLSFIFVQHLHYLGPLRNEPQVMYQAFDLSVPTKIGLKGEYTAAVLHINKNNKITYPSISSEREGKIEFTLKKDTLAVACTEWLTYLGVVTEVQTSDKGRLGYEVKVKTSPGDALQDLTHVGVGVSQVLPIVVMALLSNEKDILIFEQPELHLHPKVQSRLCDFFLALSYGNRQSVIETHSEYIVNRLRLRIAQSRVDSILNSTSILFVEKDEGKSKFRSIEISPYGSILDWPKDFFDQTDDEVESILLEASLKKRESGTNQNIPSPKKWGEI
jgi:predicted ATPase